MCIRIWPAGPTWPRRSSAAPQAHPLLTSSVYAAEAGPRNAGQASSDQHTDHLIVIDLPFGDQPAEALDLTVGQGLAHAQEGDSSRRRDRFGEHHARAQPPHRHHAEVELIGLLCGSSGVDESARTNAWR